MCIKKTPIFDVQIVGKCLFVYLKLLSLAGVFLCFLPHGGMGLPLTRRLLNVTLLFRNIVLLFIRDKSMIASVTLLIIKVNLWLRSLTLLLINVILSLLMVKMSLKDI